MYCSIVLETGGQTQRPTNWRAALCRLLALLNRAIGSYYTYTRPCSDELARAKMEGMQLPPMPDIYSFSLLTCAAWVWRFFSSMLFVTSPADPPDDDDNVVVKLCKDCAHHCFDEQILAVRRPAMGALVAAAAGGGRGLHARLGAPGLGCGRQQDSLARYRSSTRRSTRWMGRGDIGAFASVPRLIPVCNHFAWLMLSSPPLSTYTSYPLQLR